MKFLIWFGVAFGLFYYFFLVGPHYQNFKLTATIRTPDGVQTSSVVRRLTFEYRWAPLPETVREVSLEQFGEALAISYENGPTVFVPLDDSPLLALSRMVRSLPVEGVRPSIRDKKTIRAWLRGLDYKQQPQPFSQNHYPTLFIFDDINDYRTVKTFVPEAYSALLAMGFPVPEFTIEPTKEEITEGHIETIIPWIGRVERNFQPADLAVRDALGVRVIPFSDIFSHRFEN